MDRAQWQQTAEERLLAAQALLTAGMWSSAYYLSGYAVECGLKSCILAHVETAPEVIFKNKRYSLDCFTHKITELAKLAGIDALRKDDGKADQAFDTNWTIAATWDESSRYKMWNQSQAELLYNAITDASHGVMQWIRRRW